jgi:CheY-like chemotaxis protein
VACLLFVDDDYLTLETYEKIFSISGFDVLLADSGRVALELADEHKPDLIILDMSLPRMDGLTLLNLLKSSPSTRDIPVVMTSASPMIFSESAKEFGAEFTIDKPIYPENIIEILEQLSQG